MYTPTGCNGSRLNEGISKMKAPIPELQYIFETFKHQAIINTERVQARVTTGASSTNFVLAEKILVRVRTDFRRNKNFCQMLSRNCRDTKL
jgi:hypothetical protein